MNPKDVPKGKMPRHVKPMLCTLIGEPFNKDGWFFEVKWDGYRAIGEKEKLTVELYSRNGNSFNKEFPPVVEELKKIKHNFVIDGEVVAIDEKGRGKFQLLQNYMTTKKGRLVYYVFDILYLDGHDLKKLPLIRRKEILKAMLPKNSAHVKFSKHIQNNGIKFFRAAKKEGLEGIVAKNSGSPYREGQRGGDWLKIKSRLQQEAIICGYTESRSGPRPFGALILGVRKNGKLKYVGHVGTGFSEKVAKDLYKKLSKIKTDKSPFKEEVEPNEKVTWIKPKLVAELEFAEWTNEDLMRQAAFLGLRTDKPAREVVRE